MRLEPAIPLGGAGKRTAREIKRNFVESMVDITRIDSRESVSRSRLRKRLQPNGAVLVQRYHLNYRTKVLITRGVEETGVVPGDGPRRRKLRNERDNICGKGF